MPKAESSKASELKEKRKGWGEGDLFGSDNSDTALQGAGFKDKAKAMETLKILDGRDITYQYQVINTMYHRAKVMLNRIKDPQKKKDTTEAFEVFSDWIDDYKANARHKENFGYLPLHVVDSYVPLAEHYGVAKQERGVESSDESDMGFFEVYKAADGDLRKLRVQQIKDGEVSWDIYRNTNIRSIKAKIDESDKALFKRDGQLKELPTPDHVRLIMWAFSPEASRVKKVAKLVSEKLQENKDDDSSHDESEEN